MAMRGIHDHDVHAGEMLGETGPLAEVDAGRTSQDAHRVTGGLRRGDDMPADGAGSARHGDRQRDQSGIG